jgi:peptidylprolyl isomerase
MARLETEKQVAARKKKSVRIGLIGGSLIALVLGLLIFTSRGGDSETATTEAGSIGEAPKVVVPEGSAPKTLQSTDLIVGTGEEVRLGDTVQVRYTGVSFSTKKQFDSNWGEGRELYSVAGVGTDEAPVIKGWKKIVGMKVGGRRQLVIPPDLAYGAEGKLPDIKANETLVFVVDAVATTPAG